MGRNPIKLINTPVIELAYFKRSGIEGLICLGQTTGGIVHIVEIVAEIHGVQFRTPARAPPKVHILVDKLGAIQWNRIIGFLWRN